MSFEDDPGREEDELDAGDKVRKEWGWSMVDVTSRVFGIGKGCLQPSRSCFNVGY